MTKFNRFFSRFTKKSIISVAILISFACGPYFDPNEFISYFTPDSSTTQSDDLQLQFLISPAGWTDWRDSLSTDEEANIRSWAKYCKNEVEEKDISAFLYGDTLIENEFTKNVSKEAKDYLVLAKKIDLSTGNVNPWDEPKITNTPEIEGFFKQVQSLYFQAKDPFLKERYAFQTIKLAITTKRFDEVAGFYSKMIVPLPNKTFISGWAKARLASVSLSDDKARGFYEFAQVFNECPTRRLASYNSVSDQKDKYLEPALSFCKNDAEKAAVYALASVQRFEDGLPFLKKMVELNPKNPMIEFIMAREINKNEYQVFGYKGWGGYYENRISLSEEKEVNKGSYFEKLKSFASQSSNNQALPKTGFWETAIAYMEYLQKNYAEANKWLTKAKQIDIKNDALKDQIVLQEMLLLAGNEERITPQNEQKMLSFLEKLSHPTTFRQNLALITACEMLIKKYRKIGNVEEKSGGWLSSCSKKKVSDGGIKNATAKRFLLAALGTYQSNMKKQKDNEYSNFTYNSNPDLAQIEDTASVATLQQVSKYIVSPPTEFDEKLVKMTALDNNYAYTALGMKLLANERFAEASEAFKNVESKVWKEDNYTFYLSKSPFYIPLDRQYSDSTQNYLPAEFCEKLAEAKAKTEKDPNNAQAWYDLAKGSYNTSYFGNSWLLVRRWKTSEDMSDLYIYSENNSKISPDNEKWKKRRLANNYFTLKNTLTYLEKVIKTSKDQELSAKACMLAAQCQLEAYTGYSKNAYYEDDKIPLEVQKGEMARLGKIKYYFGLLKSRYENTAYQKQMIRECANYKEYTEGKLTTL